MKIETNKIICGKCKQLKSIDEFYKSSYRKRGYRFECKDCGYINSLKYKKSKRNYYLLNKEKSILANKLWVERNPEKRRAESYLKNWVRTGKIKRLPCEKCGDIKSHAHHPDYSKPLDVIWLCASHHKQAHGYRFNKSL